MQVIYIAGPFRGPTPWDIAENIRAAERIGLLVAKAGAMPLIPHANTAHFHGQQTDQFWIDGTLELLRRSDGAIFLPSWRVSSGSVGEYREVCNLGLPRLRLDDHLEPSYGVEVFKFVNWVARTNGQNNQEKL